MWRPSELLARGDFWKLAAGWFGVLLLVPAIAVVGLYPAVWWLEVIPFQMVAMKVGEFRWLIVALITITAALFFLPGQGQAGLGQTVEKVRRRSNRIPNTWLILALLISGLLLLTVDRMGMGAPVPGHTNWEGYPTDYKSSDVAARLGRIERPATVEERLGLLRHLYGLIYSTPLPTGRAAVLIELADLAVGRLKDPNNGEVHRRVVNRRLVVVSEMRDYDHPALCIRAESATDCTLTIRRRLNELGPEYSLLKELSVPGVLPMGFELAATATAAIKVELDILERQLEERIAFVNSVPYLVAASIAFIIAMYVVGFCSLMMALLLVATAVAVALSVFPFDWFDWSDYSIVFYPAFVAVVAGFLWRFLFRAYQDNVEILRSISLSKGLLFGFAVRVLIAALPFYGLIYLAHSVSQLVYEELGAAVYCESSYFVCGSSKILVYDSDRTQDTLRDDIGAGVQRLFLEFEAQAVHAAGDAPKLADTAISDITSRIMALFNSVLPPNLYDKYPDLTPPRSCRWLFPDLKCFARRIALERLNAAYQAPRNRLEASVRSSLNELGARVRSSVAIGAKEVKASIQGQANVASRYVTRSIDVAFISLSVLAIAQMAFALLVVMRALLLLAGRTLYGESRPRPVNSNSAANSESPVNSLKPLSWPPIGNRLSQVNFPLTHTEVKSQTHKDDESKKVLDVKIRPEEFELSMDDAESAIDGARPTINGALPLLAHLPLLVKRRYDVDDAYKATALFRSRYLQWPVRRLLNGCLVLRWAWLEEGKKVVRFSGPAGSRFVIWIIPEGDEVFFRWNEFVAMSASATLKKTISLRLGSLMTGTVMLPSVVGPGILIQVNRGVTEVAKIQGDRPSIYPHRLISWEAGTDFRIRSPRGILSLYCDPPSLEPAEGAQAVIDTDGGSSLGVGLLKELFRLVRP